MLKKTASSRCEPNVGESCEDLQRKRAGSARGDQSDLEARVLTEQVNSRDPFIPGLIYFLVNSTKKSFLKLIFMIGSSDTNYLNDKEMIDVIERVTNNQSMLIFTSNYLSLLLAQPRSLLSL